MFLWPLPLLRLPELSLPLLLWDPLLLVFHLELVEILRVMDMYPGKMMAGKPKL
uniref:Uncharacterized protein n=1 Tax=Picea glauca TaxID=3330 RepID=A0A117NFT8_PICGL|nr:hypothetical protein ABT39_MTgene2535 [Picea glauca]QHR89682.1 hypothetical protein Q903MT_gene3704 [Picea sitchensis]